MERPTSVMCLRTCCVKDCKPLCFTENLSKLGQPQLSRNCSFSRRTMKQRRSNSITMCTLPIIPEYPGFQDIKSSRNYLETPSFNQLFQDLERGKSSSSQLNHFPGRASLVHCLGSSSKGHPMTSSGFHDKPLQEYFDERLMELRNYESKRSNRKTKVFADKNQNPFLARRGSRRRSSCSAVAMVGHGQEGEESCSAANHDDKKGLERSHREETQSVPDLYKGDFLGLLTMYIAAPLEAFVQK
ncbi:uncharacterized protein LOC134517784 [Chroicocephalus ridibundus]|uniref:uncharacterized protein LOC134517784 n=1 Tax=Chroicocephalus ridibundus TaxID=1192867 RepID=UPI002FDD1E6A